MTSALKYWYLDLTWLSYPISCDSSPSGECVELLDIFLLHLVGITEVNSSSHVAWASLSSRVEFQSFHLIIPTVSLTADFKMLKPLANVALGKKLQDIDNYVNYPFLKLSSTTNVTTWYNNLTQCNIKFYRMCASDYKSYINSYNVLNTTLNHTTKVSSFHEFVHICYDPDYCDENHGVVLMFSLNWKLILIQ